MQRLTKRRTTDVRVGHVRGGAVERKGRRRWLPSFLIGAGQAQPSGVPLTLPVSTRETPTVRISLPESIDQ